MSVAPNPAKTVEIDCVETILSDWNGTELIDPIEDIQIETGEWVEYTVEEDGDGFYDHYLCFANVPAEHSEKVVAGVHTHLMDHGYMLNTVDFEKERCRIVSGNWARRLKE